MYIYIYVYMKTYVDHVTPCLEHVCVCQMSSNSQMCVSYVLK